MKSKRAVVPQGRRGHRYRGVQAAFGLAATGLVAGVDEAGRGPLAGPVFAAAVILDPADPIAGLGDSKALSEATRERLAVAIRGRALAFGVACADAAEIDALNILGATHLAMRRALLALARRPAHLRFDGNSCPRVGDLGLACTYEAIVGGDATVAEIGAASILAKTTRDAWMVAADSRYPGYGFAVHKGYPVPAHLDVLERLGPCALHRRSYAPVRLALAHR